MVGRMVVNEQSVSFGQGRVLQAVKVKKINETLRAHRKDKTCKQKVSVKATRQREELRV
jgi:hypothetical protein